MQYDSASIFKLKKLFMRVISPFVGGILLIVGTSIGGGMLALPVATAEAGFLHTLVFLILGWLVMTAGALYLLEVNADMPRGSNLVSMAKSTLGLPGQSIAWLAYLLLLYSLLSGYISGGSDVLQGLLANIHIILPAWMTALLFTACFGAVVYQGMRAVDYVNRGFMFGKLGIYVILVALISPHVDTHLLRGGNWSAIVGSLMILITSFGFASIVPSLRDYFHNDVILLRRAILMGSFIPLVCYILWNSVIMGTISRAGEMGLIVLMHSDHPTSGLTAALNMALHQPLITAFFSFFTAVCMVTAFLGVSIGLFDFLADGLSLKKQGHQGAKLWALTFLPPVAIVLFHPGIYIRALSYAGLCCVILLLVMPCLMVWQHRRKPSGNPRLVPGGKPALVLLLAVGVALLALCISDLAFA